MLEVSENNQPHILLDFKRDSTNISIFENKRCLDEFIKIKQEQIRNNSHLIFFDPLQLSSYIFYSLDKFYQLEIREHRQLVSFYPQQICRSDYEAVLREFHKSRFINYKEYQQLKELIDQYIDKWFKESLHKENTYPDW